MATTAATLSWGSRSSSLKLDDLGAAAGGVDGFGVDAHDLAKLADDHEFAGLVDEVNADDFPDLASGLLRPNSQNGNPSKINPEKVACFSSPNPDRQLTSFPQQSSTTHHQNTTSNYPFFAKTPSKNRVPPSPKNCCKTSHPQAEFWPLGGMTTAGTPSNSRKFSDCGECSKNVSKSKATTFLR
jgi:hypothetical protein